MIAQIVRQIKTDRQTLGEFTLTNEKGTVLLRCATLELPWKNNMRQMSCIPTGEYKVVPRVSTKFAKHYHVTNVPNRDYILIHTGNYRTQILGCILVGSNFRDLNTDGDLDVVESRVTLNKILSLAPNGFKLIIK